MIRSWHFLLTVAVVCGVMAYLYYSSDYYAERSGAKPAAQIAPAAETAAPDAAAPAEGGIIPSNE